MVTEEQRDELIRIACDIKGSAYAPYSNYLVGAALLTSDGKIYSGVNVENASFGLTVCAEQTAVFKMISEGERRIVAVAVCTENGGSPCGACRQVLSEFANDIPIWLIDGQGNIRKTILHTLLPDHFRPEHLSS